VTAALHSIARDAAEPPRSPDLEGSTPAGEAERAASSPGDEDPDRREGAG
jgi:hypothetical protein